MIFKTEYEVKRNAIPANFLCVCHVPNKTLSILFFEEILLKVASAKLVAPKRHSLCMANEFNKRIIRPPAVRVQ